MSGETDPTNSNQQSPEGADALKPSSESKPIYDLTPMDEPPPASSSPLPRGRVIETAGGKKPEQRPGRVGDEGLLEGFDDDADFDRDPEVERIVKGPGPKPSPDGAVDTRPTFVKPGMGSAEHIGVFAAGVLLAAVITACITAKSHERVWLADGVLTLYVSFLHTITGAASVAIAAHFANKQTGDLVLAAARMGLAVALFQLIFHMNIPIPGRIDEMALATVAYIGTLWAMFRWNRESLTVVVAIHAGLWLAIYLCAVLYGWAILKPPVGV